MDLLRDKCDEVSKYLYRKEGRERKLAVLNVYYGKNFPPSSYFKMRNGNIRKYIREIISSFCRYSKNLWKIFEDGKKLLINVYELNRDIFAIRGIFIYFFKE